jgi:hypothetical protein
MPKIDSEHPVPRREMEQRLTELREQGAQSERRNGDGGARPGRPVSEGRPGIRLLRTSRVERTAVAMGDPRLFLRGRCRGGHLQILRRKAK